LEGRYGRVQLRFSPHERPGLRHSTLFACRPALSANGVQVTTVHWRVGGPVYEMQHRTARWRRARILFALVACVMLLGWSVYQSERWTEAEAASSARLAALTAPIDAAEVRANGEALPLGVFSRRSFGIELAPVASLAASARAEPRASAGVLANLSQSATQATRHADRYNLVAALLGIVLLMLVVTLLVRWTVPRRVLVLLAVVGFATASLGLLALPTRL
jgi:hypothetical protein